MRAQQPSSENHYVDPGRSPGIDEFLWRVLAPRVVARMSAGLSVLLGFLAVWFKDQWYGVLFTLAAFAAVVVAAYDIWAAERQRVVALERSQKSDEADEVWFQNAVFYVVHRRWPTNGETLFPHNPPEEGVVAWRLRVEASDEFPAITAALADMRQAASDGHLTVTAHLNARRVFNVNLQISGRHLFQSVPKDHWIDHVARDFSKFRDWVCDQLTAGQTKPAAHDMRSSNLGGTIHPQRRFQARGARPESREIILAVCNNRHASSFQIF